MTIECAISKLSHAHADRRQRESKARRIEAVLVGAGVDLSQSDVLDVGTGAGYIAAYMSQRSRAVLSVDVVDERLAHGYEFRLVSSERLPVADRSRDVVISNHVIEHVDDQLLHLQEIRRVLKPGGVAYLATPNRFALIEPHFKLPLLSWLPAPLCDRYVRWTGRGARFDVQPLTWCALSDAAGEAGLRVADLSLPIARRELAARLRFSPPLGAPARLLLPSFVVLLTRCSRA